MFNFLSRKTILISFGILLLGTVFLIFYFDGVNKSTKSRLQFTGDKTDDGLTYDIAVVGDKVVYVHVGARAAMWWRTLYLNKNGKILHIDAHNAHEENPPAVSNEEAMYYFKRAQFLYKSTLKSGKGK